MAALAPAPALRPSVADRLRLTTENMVRRMENPANTAMEAVADLLPALAHAYDRAVLRRRMEHSLGYRPDLRRPQTYNEKLAWRILDGSTPLIHSTTDKFGAREYVAAKGHADILIPLLGVHDSVDDLDWDVLPDQFVLKASHGCEMNAIVRDKQSADRATILRTAAEWLRTDYYRSSREWAYRGIRPRLLVEELLTDESGAVPADLKFLVFHGRTAVIRTHLDRFGDHRVNFYDRDLQLLPVRQVYPTDPGYRPPDAVRDMVSVAEHLAEDFDYARVDLYLVGGQTRFGEITHHDGSAQVWFEPREFDLTLGRLWHLGH